MPVRKSSISPASPNSSSTLRHHRRPLRRLRPAHHRRRDHQRKRRSRREARPVKKLAALIPQEESYYRHNEGNSDSHLKTALTGPSVTLIIDQGRLLLGTWQGIYFCEFDGPRTRTYHVKLI